MIFIFFLYLILYIIIKDEELKKRKRDIDDAKISFKLVYTDENGK